MRNRSFYDPVLDCHMDIQETLSQIQAVLSDAQHKLLTAPVSTTCDMLEKHISIALESIEVVDGAIDHCDAWIIEERRAYIEKREKGIESAKANGKKSGRPRIPKPSNWHEQYVRYETGQISEHELATETGINYSTVRHWIKSGYAKS